MAYLLVCPACAYSVSVCCVFFYPDLEVILPLFFKDSNSKMKNPTVPALNNVSQSKKFGHDRSISDLPYRMIFGIASHNEVVFYDTESRYPFAYASKIHYTTLTDFSW
jgi:hypothetical protein